MKRTKPPPEKPRNSADRVRASVQSAWRTYIDDGEKLKKCLEELKKDADAGKGNARVELADFGEWLNRNKTFDWGLTLSDKDELIANGLLHELLGNQVVYKIKERIEDFCLLIANLLKNEKKFSVAVSFNNNYYNASRYNGGRGRYFIIDFLNILENEKYIVIIKGHNVKPKPRFSRTWPTEKLLERFRPIGHINSTVIGLVILRDEKGKEINFTNNKETDRISNILRKANIVNSQHEVQLMIEGKTIRLNTDLHCVFTRNFKLHGRLYTSTNTGYQGYKEKEERIHIKIDHQPVVELDFSAMHPRMLYAMEGIQYPYDDDPYTDVFKDIELRKILKFQFLRLLNSVSFKKAVVSARWELHNDDKKFIKKHGISMKTILRRHVYTIQRIFDEFKEAHKPIAKYFDDDETGLKMMRLDSKIALEIIKHFTDKNIPILAIHDSFLVQQQYHDKLRQVMDNSFSEIIKGFKCPIK